MVFPAPGHAMKTMLSQLISKPGQFMAGVCVRWQRAHTALGNAEGVIF